MQRIKAMVLWPAFLAVGLAGGGCHPLAGQQEPLASGSAGVGLLLRKLDGVKRVLMIGAHPDDEDTSLLAALSRGLGAEVAYLSLSRGEGGQNLIGEELDEGLGLVRTGELLAARSLDGGRQFFTRAFDFGYSKTAEETFRYWPREEILRDVTWVVRTFRPHVIVSVFSGTDRDGHGHHQVAGLMAQAVFETAGDPTRFPEQLEAGATLWTPSKLYRRTRFGPGDVTTTLETGRFDPLLGKSHFQLAMESRSQHRSQDMGMPRPLGPRASNLALLKSTVGSIQGNGDTFFAGVDTTFVGLARELPGSTAEEVGEAIKRYARAIASAKEELDALEPWAVASYLDEALGALHVSRRLLGERRDTELGRVLQDRIPLLEQAILASRGIVVDVRVEDDLLVPGETLGAVAEVWNGGPAPLQGVVASLEVPEGWTVAVEEGEQGVDISPGGIVRWRFSLQVALSAPVSRPYFLQEPRDGETYRWPKDPLLWGQPGNGPRVYGEIGAVTEGGTEVHLRRAALFKGVDKATGEYVKAALVIPALSVSMDPVGMVWPTNSIEAREFNVRVTNEAEAGRSGVVSLVLPEGWEATPAQQPVQLSEAGVEASFSFLVSPPAGLEEGEYFIEAKVRGPGGEVYKEGVALVDYPHIPRSALFSPASARVSVVPVEVDEELRVGYVKGSGDLGAEVLGQMGVSVELLDPDVVRSGSFQGLDVVVLGIRAYETRPDLASANEQLLAFARAGGTVVVQYNKYEFPRGDFAPYPVEMSRPHDRVSDETVPVRILDPDHALFNYPNRIDERDFEGWAQERGLYFLSAWDDRYTPLLEMSDPGEEGKRGGLLTVPLGEGLYVYTGLAFFRQFPEGVPGAFRLFANLVSLRGAGDGSPDPAAERESQDQHHDREE
jgi:LmbE family N-acetylglucosaminyl deacetylase